MQPFFVTIPHSGERVPDFCSWLKELPEEVLMCDVDRYVNDLYQPGLDRIQIPWIQTEWHRYAADLNRVPEDVDSTSVKGNSNPPGMHNRGFHWVVTTYNHQLMKEPMALQQHQELIKLVYEPFHAQILERYQAFHERGAKNIYHLDAHSMPSLGTAMHRDPGEYRADIVVSDCKGKSSCPEFVDLVIAAYVRAGFKVRMNWPYFGGRVSELYGEPPKGHHAVQVELNRALYMDEKTKKKKTEHFVQVQKQIQVALEWINKGINLLP